MVEWAREKTFIQHILLINLLCQLQLLDRLALLLAHSLARLNSFPFFRYGLGLWQQTETGTRMRSVLWRQSLFGFTSLAVDFHTLAESFKNLK